MRLFIPVRISTIAMLLLTSLIAGCGGDQSSSFDWNSAQLIYSYPDNLQHEVPRHAPIVLEFSEAVPSTIPAGTFVIKDSKGNTVSFSRKAVNNNKTLILTPDSELPPHTHYTVTASTLTTASGSALMPTGGVQFDTRAATSGPASEVSEGPFTVARMIPDGSSQPLMDFSTLRLQFTQPLDSTTVNYGTDVSLTDASGQLVDATVIAHGPYLTIDPNKDLTAGTKYTLSLSNAVKSTLGDALIPGNFDSLILTPQNSSPTTVMVQQAADSQSGSIISPLTGDPINTVPINAVLLGNNSRSQQTGDIRAELAFVPHYPNDTPLRISKGTLLNGSSVTVKINGQVPAGFDTGAISVRFISDANGYLTRNHYSSSPDAPRTVYLYMDIAMTTANAKANGGLSQDLMHVELVGTSIVKDGAMVIDAVGVVQPKVLGLENAYGTISFHMAGYKDQTNPPAAVADTSLPTLQSWEPGDHSNMARPGDPIILNFSEPLSRASLDASGAVTLLADGTPATFTKTLDGGTLVIHPQGGLQFGKNYTVQVSTQVTDLAGNPLDKTYNLPFSLPTYVTGNDRSPIVTSLEPGYPCAVTTVSRDLANNLEGRCLGGVNNDPSDHYGRNGTENYSASTAPAANTLDDIIPVARQPANRPIIVTFSQDMKAGSIRLGTSCSDTSATFRVEQIDTNGNCVATVPGQLTIDTRKVTFTPKDPWTKDQLYRYVLGSVSSGPACGGNDAICSTQNLPLQTALLEGYSATSGGPDMEIDFRGEAADTNVFNPLKNLPTADVNANFDYEAGEPGPTSASPTTNLDNSTQLLVTGVGGAVTAANVGCQNGNCPANQYVFLTGALNTEVVGYNAAQNAVQVKLHPTLLMTSSIDVYSTVASLIQSKTPTGPMVMRLRYQKDSNGQRNQLIDGWIYSTAQGPRFKTTVDAYLDAPNLVAPFESTNNQYSYPVQLNLDGPIVFLPDGRMEIGQLNTSAVPIDVALWPLQSNQTISDITNFLNSIGSLIFGSSSTSSANLLKSDIYLNIPTGGADLNYISNPIKP
ncbi:Ig-like domain-containing protein [Mangrovitalea sediminis]|uniref:Ig-like domain-containing protein n=1 Tax=Mangrovitalea sediminis TaxID=1982043 RepID=UPI000BE5C8BB|nr:Ig-like domain-containing protein [Mangrovitalea sediminis]